MNVYWLWAGDLCIFYCWQEGLVVVVVVDLQSSCITMIGMDGNPGNFLAYKRKGAAGMIMQYNNNVCR